MTALVVFAVLALGLFGLVLAIDIASSRAQRDERAERRRRLLDELRRQP